MNVVDKINLRSRLLEAVKAGRESSLDYYTFVRSTYHQLRQNIIYDNNPPEEVEPEMEDDEAPDPEPEIID
jgi:ABC-type transporter lipoprotein component MlaA